MKHTLRQRTYSNVDIVYYFEEMVRKQTPPSTLEREIKATGLDTLLFENLLQDEDFINFKLCPVNEWRIFRFN